MRKAEAPTSPRRTPHVTNSPKIPYYAFEVNDYIKPNPNYSAHDARQNTFIGIKRCLQNDRSKGA